MSSWRDDMCPRINSNQRRELFGHIYSVIVLSSTSRCAAYVFYTFLLRLLKLAQFINLGVNPLDYKISNRLYCGDCALVIISLLIAEKMSKEIIHIIRASGLFPPSNLGTVDGCLAGIAPDIQIKLVSLSLHACLSSRFEKLSLI